MMRFAFLMLALVASPAAAQLVSPLAYPSVDTSNLATTAQVQAASSAASAAQTTATGAASTAQAAQAAIPPECSVAPAKDSLNGTLGTIKCTGHSDDTRPTAVQAGNVTGGLLANCTFTITFQRAFVSSVPFIYAAVVDSSSTQMPCKIQTRSATGATGICAAAQASVVSLLGSTVLPFGTTCTVGTPVMFVGREPTQ